MTTSNYVQSDFSAEDQILELTEDQLEAVEGGIMRAPPWFDQPKGSRQAGSRSTIFWL